MLINRTNESLFNNSGTSTWSINHSPRQCKQTYHEKTPFLLSMAITVPTNTFVAYWPEVWLEQSANFK